MKISAKCLIFICSIVFISFFTYKTYAINNQPVSITIHTNNKEVGKIVKQLKEDGYVIQENTDNAVIATNELSQETNIFKFIKNGISPYSLYILGGIIIAVSSICIIYKLLKKKLSFNCELEQESNCKNYYCTSQLNLIERIENMQGRPQNDLNGMCYEFQRKNCYSHYNDHSQSNLVKQKFRY